MEIAEPSKNGQPTAYARDLNSTFKTLRELDTGSQATLLDRFLSTKAV